MMKLVRKQCAFSLIEILIAVVFFGLIAIAVMRAIQGLSKQETAIAGRVQAEAQLGEVLREIQGHWRYRISPDAAAFLALPPTVSACGGLRIVQRLRTGVIVNVDVITQCRAAGPAPGPAAFNFAITCIPEVVLTTSAGARIFPTVQLALGTAMCFTVRPTGVDAQAQSLIQNGTTTSAVGSRVYLSVNDRAPGVEFVK